MNVIHAPIALRRSPAHLPAHPPAHPHGEHAGKYNMLYRLLHHPAKTRLGQNITAEQLVQEIALSLLTASEKKCVVNLKVIAEYWTKLRECPPQSGYLFQLLQCRLGVAVTKSINLSEPAILFGCVMGILAFEFGIGAFAMDVVGLGVKHALSDWEKPAEILSNEMTRAEISATKINPLAEAMPPRFSLSAPTAKMTARMRAEMLFKPKNSAPQIQMGEVP
ncbi:MAG: hypothetical protein ORN98_06240 [Alphaproteobacteria bacterium]|nr:hypothetical protein [Alphaproteobacteria bacterium]